MKLGNRGIGVGQEWPYDCCACSRKSVAAWIIDCRSGDFITLCKKHLRSLVDSGAKALALEEMKDKPMKKR